MIDWISLPQKIFIRLVKVFLFWCNKYAWILQFAFEIGNVKIKHSIVRGEFYRKIKSTFLNLKQLYLL